MTADYTASCSYYTSIQMYLGTTPKTNSCSTGSSLFQKRSSQRNRSDDIFSRQAKNA